MRTTYLCVKCPHCAAEIPLCECSLEYYAKLPSGDFTLEHGCGWIGRFDQLDAARKVEMERIPSFKPHPAFQQIPLST